MTAGTDANGTATIKMWTHNAGNEAELGAINAIVSDYNASQAKYKVEVQAFPQDSYNTSVTAAASSKSLPCILDIDGPNVPNWAWAGYLAPLTGLDDTLAKFLPSTVGTYQGKPYAAGFYDVALAMYARKSVLEQNNIRIPTIDQPWTEDEFNAALATLKATGQWANPLDMATANTGEWWPYAYSPFLQSFGGDLIDRTKYESADGVLNGADALKWATWFRGLVDQGYMAAKSGADAGADFLNDKSAIVWNGSWGAEAARAKLGDDIAFLPPPDFGNGPKIGGGSWQWGVSATCNNTEGAMDYLKFSLQDKYVAAVVDGHRHHPGHRRRRRPGQGLRGRWRRRHLPAVLEEVRRGPAADPGLPVHRDHLHQGRAGHPERCRSAGRAGSGGLRHRREPEVEQQLPVTDPAGRPCGAVRSRPAPHGSHGVALNPRRPP